jgi:2-keto-3-deoxy-L-rhamnonate aldolase
MFHKLLFMTMLTMPEIVTSSVAIPPPGVYVPTVTFFKSYTSPAARQAPLDIATQCQHSVHLAKNGVTGLVLLGSTGEAVHLSRAERFELLSGVRNGLAEAGYINYPIMAGVLTNSVDEALEWLDDAKKAGSQWGLVLAPGYFGAAANQENLREWYKLVADASPIPILMYAIPSLRICPKYLNCRNLQIQLSWSYE